VLAGTIVTWFFSDQIIDILLRPAREAGENTLYFNAPMEAFMLKLKASVVVGILIGFPLILLRIYMFVLPGLLPREKRVVTPLLFTATMLFYVGVAFCYFVLLPLVIRFALSFATEFMQPWLTVGSYFAMAARLCLAFGLLFELPMVVFALSWAGVVHPKTLLKGWRWALLCILIVSAVLTPPDIISQVLLAGPVMLLYIASVLISMVVRRRGEDMEEAEDEDEDDPDPPEDPGGGAPPAHDDPPRPRPAAGSRARDQHDGEEDVESVD
jgi:sec-independent protein translocase protein TatC